MHLLLFKIQGGELPIFFATSVLEAIDPVDINDMSK